MASSAAVLGSSADKRLGKRVDAMCEELDVKALVMPTHSTTRAYLRLRQEIVKLLEIKKLRAKASLALLIIIIIIIVLIIRL
jgi:hypothetical protein